MSSKGTPRLLNPRKLKLASGSVTRPDNPVFVLDSVSNKGEAVLLADHIAGYWQDRGYFGVSVRVEEDRIRRKDRPFYAIRSNLVDGLPPAA